MKILLKHWWKISILLFLLIILMFLIQPRKEKRIIENNVATNVIIREDKNIFGKVNSGGGYIVKEKRSEEIKIGKSIYSGETLITKDKKVVISNQNSIIDIMPDSKIITQNNDKISIKKGGVKIKGNIKTYVNNFFISGNGEITIKISDDGVSISLYNGKAKIISKDKTIELKEKEGTILYNDNTVEEPFTLPEETEIKVKVY